MSNIWEQHFEYYDLFQNNFSCYSETIRFHVEEMKSHKHILDLGAGTGNLTKALLIAEHTVTAIDPNENAIQILEAKCSTDPNLIDALIMHGEQLAFTDKSFDGIVCMFVIPFARDTKQVLQEIFRTLKSNGSCSLSVWAPEPDTFKHLKQSLETELKEKNILPTHREQFDRILKSDKILSQIVTQGPTKSTLLQMLKEIGFTNIKETKTSYGKYAYNLVVQK